MWKKKRHSRKSHAITHIITLRKPQCIKLFNTTK